MRALDVEAPLLGTPIHATPCTRGGASPLLGAGTRLVHVEAERNMLAEWPPRHSVYASLRRRSARFSSSSSASMRSPFRWTSAGGGEAGPGGPFGSGAAPPLRTR